MDSSLKHYDIGGESSRENLKFDRCDEYRDSDECDGGNVEAGNIFKAQNSVIEDEENVQENPSMENFDNVSQDDDHNDNNYDGSQNRSDEEYCDHLGQDDVEGIYNKISHEEYWEQLGDKEVSQKRAENSSSDGSINYSEVVIKSDENLPSHGTQFDIINESELLDPNDNNILDAFDESTVDFIAHDEVAYSQRIKPAVSYDPHFIKRSGGKKRTFADQVTILESKLYSSTVTDLTNDSNSDSNDCEARKLSLRKQISQQKPIEISDKRHKRNSSTNSFGGNTSDTPQFETRLTRNITSLSSNVGPTVQLRSKCLKDGNRSLLSQSNSKSCEFACEKCGKRYLNMNGLTYHKAKDACTDSIYLRNCPYVGLSVIIDIIDINGNYSYYCGIVESFDKYRGMYRVTYSDKENYFTTTEQYFTTTELESAMARDTSQPPLCHIGKKVVNAVVSGNIVSYRGGTVLSFENNTYSVMYDNNGYGKPYVDSLTAEEFDALLAMDFSTNGDNNSEIIEIVNEFVGKKIVIKFHAHCFEVTVTAYEKPYLYFKYSSNQRNHSRPVKSTLPEARQLLKNSLGFEPANFVGKKFREYFVENNNVYEGTVSAWVSPYFRVIYTDGDEQDKSKSQLIELLRQSTETASLVSESSSNDPSTCQTRVLKTSHAGNTENISGSLSGDDSNNAMDLNINALSDYELENSEDDISVANSANAKKKQISNNLSCTKSGIRNNFDYLTTTATDCLSVQSSFDPNSTSNGSHLGVNIVTGTPDLIEGPTFYNGFVESFNISLNEYTVRWNDIRDIWNPVQKTFTTTELESAMARDTSQPPLCHIGKKVVNAVVSGNIVSYRGGTVLSFENNTYSVMYDNYDNNGYSTPYVDSLTVDEFDALLAMDFSTNGDDDSDKLEAISYIGQQILATIRRVINVCYFETIVSAYQKPFFLLKKVYYGISSHTLIKVTLPELRQSLKASRNKEPMNLLGRKFLVNFESTNIFYVGMVSYWQPPFYEVIYGDGDYEEKSLRQIKKLLKQHHINDFIDLKENKKRSLSSISKSLSVLRQTKKQKIDTSLVPWQHGGSPGTNLFGGFLPVTIEIGSKSTELSFFSTLFSASRTLVLNQNFTTLVGLQKPAAQFTQFGVNYELVSVKVRDNGFKLNAYGGAKKKSVEYIYVGVSGVGLSTISLTQELEKIANFRKIGNVGKIVSRLQLFQSGAIASCPPRTMRFCDFEIIDEKISHVTGESMSDGCGFIPCELLAELLGGNVNRLLAIQVRIFGPKLGVWKGMLCRKPGITNIQLPRSMCKVEKSEHPEGDWVCLVVIRKNPSSPNTDAAKYFEGNTSPAASKPSKPLSLMIKNLLSCLKVPEQIISRHKRKPHPEHAWMVGLADPTDAIPAGCIFITGAHLQKVTWPKKVFVTRSPCVLPEHGRMLERICEKPYRMKEQVWEWLLSLPFGGIIFSVLGNGVPIPLTVSEGDLDGDLFFVCWDTQITDHIEERRLPAYFKGSSSKSSYSMSGADSWMQAAQRYFDDDRILEESAIVSKVYGAWNKVVRESPRGMDDPDAIGWAKGYLQALDFAKHGLTISLPANLLQEVPSKIGQKYVKYFEAAEPAV